MAELSLNILCRSVIYKFSYDICPYMIIVTLQTTQCFHRKEFLHLVPGISCHADKYTKDQPYGSNPAIIPTYKSNLIYCYRFDSSFEEHGCSFFFIWIPHNSKDLNTTESVHNMYLIELASQCSRTLETPLRQDT